MARQGGWVQLEQSDMHLALTMPKMAKGVFSHVKKDETQWLIKKPWADIQEVQKWGVEFPALRQLKAAIESHPAMVHENHTDSCLPCQNNTAKNPHTGWRSNRMGAPPPD